MNVLNPNYPRENVVKGDEVPNFKIGKPTCTSTNVFQILQDLRLKRHSGNFERKAYRPSTTSTTGTTQPKSHEKASKNTIGTVNIDNIDNTSKNPTPCRTMRPPKTSSFRTMPTPTTNANQPASDRQPSHLQSGLPPCCMHVLQA